MSDSKAMKILTMYSDSDEEETAESHGIGRKRRSTGTNEKMPETKGEDEEENEHLPDAPESLTGESQRSSTSRKSSPWSDDDDRESTRSPKEPPPPARPDFLHSPSPGGSSETPATISNIALKMPRIDSQQTLVAYVADDDDLDESHRISRNDDVLATNVNEILRENAKLNENSAPNSVKSSEPADDLDSYTLLEKSLENRLQDSPSVELEPELLMPPETTKRCAPELEAKFRSFFEQKARGGVNFNKAIQSRKDFRNPSMYEKLVEHFGLDELGTNFRKEIFDPHGFKPQDFYEELSKAQRQYMEKTEKDKPAAGSKEAQTAEDKKRKSKWDNPTSSSQAPAHSLPIGRMITTVKSESSVSNMASNATKKTKA